LFLVLLLLLLPLSLGCFLPFALLFLI